MLPISQFLPKLPNMLYPCLESYKYRLKFLSKMLGTRSISDCRYFQILDYLHICHEITWRWDPGLNMKFICFMYILYTEFAGNVTQYFQCTSSYILTVSHHVWLRSDMEFSVSGVISALTNFCILEHFRSHIFLFRILKLYSLLPTL
jgi:hypothetical protein